LSPVVDGAVEREIRIEAEPAVVFEFFTDPAKVVRWQGMAAEVEPRPGGVYRVTVNSRDVARGEFVEVVPHSRVVFTWGWEGDEPSIAPGASTVEVTLEPDGDGTLVRLVHSDLPSALHEGHDTGWGHYTERLAIAAAGGDPGPDPWSTPEAADADLAG
jgi:uncharacterized protein YndB with AHSA1/START domain